jgi:hypothetical protein
VGISITFDDSVLQAKLKRGSEEQTRELNLATIDSLDWIREEARTNHRFVTRSGAAEQAIQSEINPNQTSGTVSLNKDRAPYIDFQHEGTGEFGPHGVGFTVEGKNTPRHILHWVAGGESFFAKKVFIHGIHPDQFLYRARNLLFDRVVRRYVEAIVNVIRNAGLK